MSLLPIKQNGSFACVELLPDDPAAFSVIFGYILPCLCFCGAIGNVLNLFVLKDKSLMAPTYTYLAFLAAFQLVVCLHQCAFMIGLLHFSTSENARTILAYYIWPIFSWSAAQSLAFTVTYTVERYLFVRGFLPNSDPKARKFRARFTCLIVCGFTTCFNVPYMLAFLPGGSGECLPNRWLKTGQTWFQAYAFIRFFVFNSGAIVILIVFNTLLACIAYRSFAKVVRRARVKRRISSDGPLTMTLIIATCLALVGEIPSALFNPITDPFLWRQPPALLLLDMTNRRMYRYLPFVFLTIEYSGNIAVYFMLNSNFRKIFSYKCRKISASNTPSLVEQTSMTAISTIITDH